MGLFDIFSRKRREEERQRREAEASRAGTIPGGDGGYNPIVYGPSAISDNSPTHSPSCGSASSSQSDSGSSCSGGDGGGGGGGD